MRASSDYPHPVVPPPGSFGLTNGRRVFNVHTSSHHEPLVRTNGLVWHSHVCVTCFEHVKYHSLSCPLQNLNHKRWLSSCEQDFTSGGLGARGGRHLSEEEDVKVIADRLQLYGALQAEVMQGETILLGEIESARIKR